MQREFELKLEFDEGELGQVTRWLPARHAAQKSPARALRTVYFDTPDFSLYRSGVSLRVRKAGKAYVQTIKYNRRAGVGVFDRTEWEQEVDGFHPDAAAARKTNLKPFRRKAIFKALQPVFEVRVRRSIYRVESGGSCLELALDRGKVLCGRKGAAFQEMEIELIEGKAGDLFKFARALGRSVPLRLGMRTKFERGVALHGAEKSAAHHAAKIALAPKTAAEEAFRAIARGCLGQLLLNQAAAVNQDGEAIHRMRVAIRRLRASISAFRAMTSDGSAERVKDEMGWLMKHLGHARDLDVLLNGTLACFGSGGKSLAPVKRNFEARRRQAYRQVKAALSSPRFHKLMFDTLAWIECGSWGRKRGALAAAQREQEVAAYAARELRRRHGKFIKSIGSFGTITAAERHRQRIRAKKLRYAVEFFGGAFPGRRNAERRAEMLSALKKLQDSLGSLNDIATCEKYVAGLAAGCRSKGVSRNNASIAARVIARGREARSRGLLDAADAASRAIVDAKPFWT